MLVVKSRAKAGGEHWDITQRHTCSRTAADPVFPALYRTVIEELWNHGLGNYMTNQRCAKCWWIKPYESNWAAPCLCLELCLSPPARWGICGVKQRPCCPCSVLFIDLYGARLPSSENRKVLQGGEDEDYGYQERPKQICDLHFKLQLWSSEPKRACE